MRLSVLLWPFHNDCVHLVQEFLPFAVFCPAIFFEFGEGFVRFALFAQPNINVAELVISFIQVRLQSDGSLELIAGLWILSNSCVQPA